MLGRDGLFPKQVDEETCFEFVILTDIVCTQPEAGVVGPTCFPQTLKQPRSASLLALISVCECQ